ncbi:hypothetical protein BBK14_11360 [Parafrankia soli]|uniref:Uncharacterized protein n=1 Tax=Parafrankia soli TaxID=2599596 RepID=A0A1S1R8Y5_9ACTN|nr:hypothetical protein BBK14_11360 [Parafrankia soli]
MAPVGLVLLGRAIDGHRDLYGPRSGLCPADGDRMGIVSGLVGGELGGPDVGLLVVDLRMVRAESGSRRRAVDGLRPTCGLREVGVPDGDVPMGVVEHMAVGEVCRQGGRRLGVAARMALA